MSPQRLICLAVTSLLLSCPSWGHQESSAEGQRAVLEQILTQSYQPSLVGKHLMGVGSATEIRRAGVIVVVKRPGLYASINRAEIASTAIHGLDAKVYRGNKDYAVPVGERFYIFAVSVGSDEVTFGLITGRPVTVGKGTQRLWAAVSFHFTAETVSSVDKDLVFRTIDEWFVPEGRSGVNAPYTVSTAAPGGPAGAPVAMAAPAPVAQMTSPPADLKPGMTRDEIVAAMGPPQREVSYEGKTWMTYPGMVLVLEGGKFVSMDQSGQATAKVAIHSEPTGAEIYVDGEMVGQTPSTVNLSPGSHLISVTAAGYQDWVRKMRVLSGSDVNLDAKLEKK